MVVVLPAPLGPSRPKHSPARISRSSPFTAATSAYRLWRFRTSSGGGAAFPLMREAYARPDERLAPVAPGPDLTHHLPGSLPLLGRREQGVAGKDARHVDGGEYEGRGIAGHGRHGGLPAGGGGLDH